MTTQDRYKKIKSEAENAGRYTKDDSQMFNAFLVGYYESAIKSLLYELEFTENIIELRDKEIRIIKGKING
jgi:predicted amidophosphoribosyltransferase